MDGSRAGRPGGDRFGGDRFAPDGTQPPPPPPLFPDPLAGLVTGERQYRPPATAIPTAPAVPRPVPAQVPPTRRAPARRSAQASRPPAQAPAQHVSGQPAASTPYAELARRQPEPVGGQVEPRKGRGALIGCLVALVALGGLLFTVVREIVEAVVDLLR
ncbi:hypothetical protein AB0G02_11720 [Actinosynnema sp. NPDC023658]|uniref:hypothetical protein n=1 Tax=Actinosynnema sp. NPDC023658 TaxID=3155465 RepID=UPI0033F7677D